MARRSRPRAVGGSSGLVSRIGPWEGSYMYRLSANTSLTPASPAPAAIVRFMPGNSSAHRRYSGCAQW